MIVLLRYGLYSNLALSSGCHKSVSFVYVYFILLLIGFFNLIYIFKIPLEILENQLTVMYYCPLHVKDFEFFLVQ